MKKLICLLLVCMCLTSCAPKQVTELKDTVACMGGYTFCITQDGNMYYVDDDLIHYKDFAAKASAVLCDKAACEHETYHPVYNPIPSCTAVSHDSLQVDAVISYGDALYLLTCVNVNELTIYKCNLQGADRKKLATVKAYSSRCNIVCTEEMLYIAAYWPDWDIKNGDMSSDYYCEQLYAVNTQTGKVTELIEESRTKGATRITGFVVAENEVYINYRDGEYNGGTGDELKSFAESECILKYDNMTGETKELFEEKKSGMCTAMGIYNDKLVYSVNENNTTYYYKLDTKTNESELFYECEQKSVRIEMIDGTILRYDVSSGGEEIKIADGTVREIAPDIMGEIIDIVDGQILISVLTSDGMEMLRIEKEKFLNYQD